VHVALRRRKIRVARELLDRTLGALGVRKTKLTLPPFIPARVVSQYRFWREEFHPGRQRGLHVYPTSQIAS
jgi:hypothetical protein